jgi:hypothetical protein
MKPGHSLREIDRFPVEVTDRLRDELSVTTAEEFVDLGNRMRGRLRSVLQLDDRLLRELLEAATDTLSPQQRREVLEPRRGHYPFATGHDAPVDGETFYDEDRDRE